MNYSRVAEEVKEVANRCSVLIDARRRDQAEEVRRTSEMLEPLIDEFRIRLIKRLDPYTNTGSPPSLLRIIGQSHLERPFNRILKWSADEHKEHGFGREFLKLLAARVGLPEMKEDLEQGAEIEFWGEQAFDSSGNMPDLVVRTSIARTSRAGAALLFENKVQSGESGKQQYASYLKSFSVFAKGRKSRIVLSARYKPDKPTEWDDPLTHAELAGVFRELARHPKVPIWGRIVAIQFAVALENADDDPVANALLAMRQTDCGRDTLQHWKTLLDFQPTTLPVKPWQTT